MKATDVELVLSDHFNYRQNLIVPNVHWGMNLLYEADMVVLRKSGWAVEIEIKVTAADIKADTKKRHQHDSRLFKELWFAVPIELAEHPMIPAHAGILAAWRYDGGRVGYGHSQKPYLKGTRAPTVRRDAKKWSDADRIKLLSLGSMRVWTLKAALARNNERAKGATA